MSYEIINSIPQFNFQINRILTYGELACNKKEVIGEVAQVKTFEEWSIAWQKIAIKSEHEKRHFYAAYYYRMAEFFLKSDMPEKAIVYEKCIENFYKAFDSELHLQYEKCHIPFEGKSLLESSEIESIFGNCDFLYMLSQAAGDQKVLASHLGISPHQLSYVTHSGSGEGLLFYGDTTIPFVDHFPQDTELYTLLTTKPEDKANGQA